VRRLLHEEIELITDTRLEELILAYQREKGFVVHHRGNVVSAGAKSGGDRGTGGDLYLVAAITSEPDDQFSARLVSDHGHWIFATTRGRRRQRRELGVLALTDAFNLSPDTLLSTIPFDHTLDDSGWFSWLLVRGLSGKARIVPRLVNC
jgi:hypothetical protein